MLIDQAKDRAGRLLAALLILASCAFGFDWKTLKPQGRLSDFAGVVDANSRVELERYAARVQQATGAEIAIVTVRSLEEEPIEDVANALFRAWGVGQKGKNEGILLLLAMHERRSRVEVGYGLEPILPDGFAGSVLREMRPALREQHIGEALLAAAHLMGERIAQAKGVQLGDAPRRSLQPRLRHSIPWPLVIGAGLLLFPLLLRGSRGPMGARRYGGYSAPIFLPGGSDWSSRRGGGGFGGYDSSDSFGGFGGGDSGGGGSSSNW
ncbi:MAG: TPM domain-containing protein [Bryobacteraceae bacterium]